jgi:hypothetical protein
MSKIYMSLPDDSIAEVDLVDRICVEKVVVGLATGAGKKLKVKIGKPDDAVRIYVLNVPITDVYEQTIRMKRELLDLRSKLAVMAMRLGFDDDVPTAENGFGWPQLASKIGQKVDHLKRHVDARVSEVLGDKIFKKGRDPS